MLGLAEAVPAQAVMVPVTEPAVITGKVEFTVIENVTGVPAHSMALAVIKLPPIEPGCEPTAIVARALSAVLVTSMTVTLFEKRFSTYNKLPSLANDIPTGPVFTAV